MIARALPALAAIVLVAALAGCTTIPATGEPALTLMSAEQEAAIGREEHPKLLAAMGGAYEERPALTRYVTTIGRRLQAVSEMPEPPFTFTIVNSDTVNAFALPGGYVYVTRGLMALANSEAELAGVIAHEIGHVTARHTAQRYSQSILAQLGAVILGAATGSRAVAEIANLGAAVYVQSFSRAQELEADELGIRYLARAGYDPRAMASFLEAMEREAALARKIAGREGVEPEASLFSSHPRTAVRIVEAAEAAARAGPPQGAWRVEAEPYLLMLDGTLYGDDPEQGLRRGRVFAHPKLGFRFEVPPGFRLENTPQAVIASHRNGAVVIFDGARYRGDVGRYLRDVWMEGLAVGRIERISVNGMAAATAATRVRTRAGTRDLRGIVIRFDADTVYRFLILTPPAVTAELNVPLRRMTFSFRRLDADEIAALKPLRVRAHRVGPGETIARLAAGLPFEDFREERLRVLNGLGPGEDPAPGRLIKLIAE